MAKAKKQKQQHGSYAVDYWGSHPDRNNDDCWTGRDFPSKEEALAFYNAEPAYYFNSSTQFIVLSDPTGQILCIRKNPGYQPTPDDQSDWKREAAMQAAMAFGCQGWNDYYG